MAINATDTGKRYSKVAMWLHLLIGAAVITNIGLALLTGNLAKSTQISALAVHKALGITVLGLTVVLIAWRLTHKPPPLPAATPAWQRPISKVVHFLFYALLLLLPLSGWLWMSAANKAVNYFGLFQVPALVGPDKAFATTMSGGHEVMGWSMLVLVVLHILAALKHQYFDRTDLISRMNPFG